MTGNKNAKNDQETSNTKNAKRQFETNRLKEDQATRHPQPLIQIKDCRDTQNESRSV